MIDIFLQSISLLQEDFLHEIILLSLKVTLAALLLSLIIALPLGTMLAMSQMRGSRFLTIILHTLLGLPPVVAGLTVYLLFSRSGTFGFLGLLYSPAAMIIAQMLIIIPIVAVHCRQAVAARWQELKLLLTSLGARQWQCVVTLLHDVRYQLLTAVLAGFGRGISEVGAVAIVGGNIEHQTRVMTTAISLETSQGELALAMSLGLILLTLALMVNWFSWRVTDRQATREIFLLP